MSTSMSEFMSPEQAIPRLVAEAEEFDRQERRREPRLPLFREATIRLADGKWMSAYTRNISQTGVGILHSHELPLEEVEVTIVTEPEQVLKLRARVERCESYSDGLFISGLQFLFAREE